METIMMVLLESMQPHMPENESIWANAIILFVVVLFFFLYVIYGIPFITGKKTNRKK